MDIDTRRHAWIKNLIRDRITLLNKALFNKDDDNEQFVLYTVPETDCNGDHVVFNNDNAFRESSCNWIGFIVRGRPFVIHKKNLSYMRHGVNTYCTNLRDMICIPYGDEVTRLMDKIDRLNEDNTKLEEDMINLNKRKRSDDDISSVDDSLVDEPVNTGIGTKNCVNCKVDRPLSSFTVRTSTINKKGEKVVYLFNRNNCHSYTSKKARANKKQKKSHK